MLLSCRWFKVFCKWRSVWSRHDGHCDEATPDERAPAPDGVVERGGGKSGEMGEAVANFSG